MSFRESRQALQYLDDLRGVLELTVSAFQSRPRYEIVHCLIREELAVGRVSLEYHKNLSILRSMHFLVGACILM